MAKLVLVLANSGQGKSYSMHSMDPAKTCLVRAIKKDLPFPNARHWKAFDPKTKTGNIFTTDQAHQIVEVLKGCQTNMGRNIVVLDDFQYTMANDFMRTINDKGYDKFNTAGYNAWSVIKTASELPDDMRVYFMWHVDVEEDGRIKAKTVGKITDRYVTPEGYFPICLGCFKEEGKGYFRTNSANDLTPYKSPPEMFEEVIENNLADVDRKICEYYGIEEK